MAKVNIKESLSEVLTRIRHASQRRPPELDRDVRLVAVSKTKPKELIIEAYSLGQRYFGENYVNELFEKSNDPEILETCSDIKWHFIGRLAKKQINKLLGVKNLHVWETVDNQVKADMINGSLERNFGGRSIKAMIQVNTSGEEGKNGVEPDKTGDLLQHILDKCPHLQVIGLMTIGSLEHSLNDDLNPDFRCLIDCRKSICKRFGLDLDSFELSMGMSNDFEKAIEMGSTSVRVGSLIFGAREYPPKNKDETVGK